MLSLDALTKSYGPLPVLAGATLAVRPGRVTALVGPNGAGKTTLIKSVLGLVRPDGGAVRLDGALVGGPQADPRAADAARARIGYMPQIARFPENLTARELLALVADVRAKSGAAAAGATCDDAPLDDELLDRFALAPHLDKPLRALSGGTRQKVNAVLAFRFRPALLILDEPTAGLDPASSAILKDKIAAERAAGRTFVLTSHVMSELEELADDVAFLVEGRIAFAGAVSELLAATRQTRLERAVAQMMGTGVRVVSGAESTGAAVAAAGGLPVTAAA